VAGDEKSAIRSANTSLSDTMRFTPDTLQFKRNSTVKLIYKNEGKILHEFVIGTKKELPAYAALMVKFPAMAHDESYMVHVPPGESGKSGKSGQISWTFNRTGNFELTCLIAGHYQAGMVGKITVTA
jgi:uncharacterized cupredoxin-like copper-binding protein